VLLVILTVVTGVLAAFDQTIAILPTGSKTDRRTELSQALRRRWYRSNQPMARNRVEPQFELASASCALRLRADARAQGEEILLMALRKSPQPELVEGRTA
jgi:hypothetical protein